MANPKIRMKKLINVPIANAATRHVLVLFISILGATTADGETVSIIADRNCPATEKEPRKAPCGVGRTGLQKVQASTKEQQDDADGHTDKVNLEGVDQRMRGPDTGSRGVRLMGC